MTEPRPDPARRALSVVAEAARQADLDGTEAKVLRVRNSIHVELPRGDVVARVEGPLDLEDAGRGPASWDFAPLAVGVERYGLPPEDFHQFAVGYRAEPRGWSGHRLMCDVYELLVTSWAVRCSIESRRMEREAAVRVSGLLGSDPTRWTLL